MELIRRQAARSSPRRRTRPASRHPATFDELEERIIAAADVTLDGGETQHQHGLDGRRLHGRANRSIIREGAIPADADHGSAQAGDA